MFFDFSNIRSGHDKTEITKHLRDAAHADTADADEMNSFYVSEHSYVLSKASKQLS